MNSRNFLRGWTASLLVGIAVGSYAQVIDKEAYIAPPKPVADLLNAPRHLNVNLTNLSPDGSRFLIANSGGMSDLQSVGKVYFTLGGLQVDANANRARSMTTRGAVGYDLFEWNTSKRYSIQIPPGSKVTGAAWSNDGKQVAFFAHFELRSEIWIAEAASGKTRRLSGISVLPVHVTNLQWVNGDKEIVSVVVPDNRTPTPKRPRIASQPRVMVTNSGRDSLRTYRGLLETQYDQDLLEYYSVGQLVRIDAKSGQVKRIGEPKMILSVNPSPDGKHFIVRTMLKPFSYLVPMSSFGTVEEIWDESGKAVVEIRKTPLRTGGGAPDPDFFDEDDEQGRGGRGGGGQAGATNNGRRNLSWRPDGEGLSYLQLEPQQQGQATRQDQVIQWVAPFGKDDAKPIYKTNERIGSVSYAADMKTLFLTGTAGSNSVLYTVNIDQPEKKTTLYSYATDDFYANPGRLMTAPGAKGVDVVRVSSTGRVFLSGTQYSKDPEKEAPRPFLDAVSISDGKKERVWHSSDTMYETLNEILDSEGSTLVLNRQSRDVLPDNWLYSTQTKDAKKLTQNVDYQAEVSRCPTQRIQVTRVDGFKFWVTVTTPKFFVAGQKAPAMFWFYPSEFATQQAYNDRQRTYNKNQFPTFGNLSVEYLTTLGYVIVEPDCPIVGPQNRINDFYLSDLRNNLSATIDELDKRGLIDRDRLGIGGHSYGAFSTAHAMIQTPYFKAGIAGDGNYNRTLTPFAFQSEQRLIWESRELYINMSPMLYAENLNGALLMYHGMDDMNVGTHPINSERMFNALEVLGKTASLYMYPYEDHGPIASETLNDIWARWVEWLDRYVKNAGKEKPKEAGDGGTN
ncbi:MAG: S9 family peptidase [Fimbriimonadaceae bacterium]|nr:S9 family peptidase [Fimbriimonadaceae bacterium]